jgi:hypothetical protein
MASKTFKINYKGCEASIIIGKNDTMKDVWEKLSKIDISGLAEIDDTKPFQMFADGEEIKMASQEEVTKDAEKVLKNIKNTMDMELKETVELLHKAENEKIDVENIKLSDDLLTKYFDQQEEVEVEPKQHKLPTALTSRNKKLPSTAFQPEIANPVEQN